MTPAITILVVLCSMVNGQDCREVTVTTSDFADISLQSCLMGAPQIADWMRENHPAERLKAWRCVVGERKIAS